MSNINIVARDWTNTVEIHKGHPLGNKFANGREVSDDQVKQWIALRFKECCTPDSPQRRALAHLLWLAQQEEGLNIIIYSPAEATKFSAMLSYFQNPPEDAVAAVKSIVPTPIESAKKEAPPTEVPF